jgi:hypothetical protein
LLARRLVPRAKTPLSITGELEKRGADRNGFAVHHLVIADP